MGVERACGVFDRKDGFGQKRIVAGDLDAVRSEDKNQGKNHRPERGHVPQVFFMPEQRGGDGFFELGAIDPARITRKPQRDTGDLLWIAFGAGGKQINQVVTHLARQLACQPPIDQAELSGRGNDKIAGVGVAVKKPRLNDL